MAVLVIDTATAACSIALIEDGRCLGEAHEVVGRGHAERLLPMIRDLLGDRVPSEVLVDCGPGSFTGIRVGIAAARAFGLAWGVPVRGYSSLTLIAAGHAAGGAAAVAIIGGHGELFVQRFSAAPRRAVTELASLRPEAAAEVVPEFRVLGSGAADLVAARGFGEAVDALPRAADATLLSEDETALPPRPLYGRAPDAKAAA
ncbi:tRNA (adenosine(37)-N6)-threonylcarbamoyltransferase complex dimerization subunit type 1 TsaB [Sphingomonas sp. ID0503]|uniref:tRNA (adenosine(37)-N6)-threonylcarbamoyltransferase complex dimerization subunit type 1 TsaB n=1 Tax=Sphingomonas sp. ID0503 TaxID=3399691 RepID=UPI003AFA25E4